MQGRVPAQRMKGRGTRDCSLGTAREPNDVSWEYPKQVSGDGYLSEDPEDCRPNAQCGLADERGGGQVERQKNEVPQEVLSRD